MYTTGYSFPAPIVTQQWLVEEESVVQNRPLARSQMPRKACAGFRGLSAGVMLSAGLVFSVFVPQFSPAAAPGEEPRIEATGKADPLEAEVIVTSDGLRLGLRHWDAAPPRAIIVALHGMNDYSRAFAIPAPRWAELGFTTYAYDQRGFGRSPDAGRWQGSALMRRDLRDVVIALRARHPNVPLYVLGESMGGAVVMSALDDGPEINADGYILVAPAVLGWGALPITHRAALWLVAHIAPGWTMTGSQIEIMPSDNIEMLIENGRDPLFLKDTRADSVYGLVDLMDEAYESGPALSGIAQSGAPVLFVYGSRDEIIPNYATEEVLAAVDDAVEIKHYPEGYHMILRDLEAAPRWDDVGNWILGHLGEGRAVGARAAAEEAKEAAPR
jgi:acylglycerol lipase